MKHHLPFIFFFLFYCTGVPAQTIGMFSSVQPTAQTQNLVLPATHTFQRIIRSGATLPSGETMGSTLDFTGYVPISGSSTNGYLAISSESNPAGCAILSVSLDPTIKLWSITNGGNVPLPFTDLGVTRTFCAGTVTPANRIMVCEETVLHTDENSYGYNDDGWIIEIDPATRTVVNQDGAGGVDKLWAMGRQRHEDVVIKQDQSVAYWSGDDATYGHVYKFVPTLPGNFSAGTLYVLQTTATLGTGSWQQIANTTQTERNNTQALSTAAGAYNFSRVEGIEMGPDGKLYFASATSGNIYRFRDLGTTVDALEVFVASSNYDVDGAGPFAPEPWGTGADNIAFDGEGNLWVLQDGDRSHIWVVEPGHTAADPRVRLFATTPAGSEPTGITFSPDYKYLFLSIQHPSANATPQTDAAGSAVVFDESTTIVIARKENLGAAVLPLNLLSFEAIQKGKAIELEWKLSAVAEEVFEVERSADGIRFESIGKIIEKKAAYSYVDRLLPAADRLYYRLKMKERNGRVHYSAIYTVQLRQESGIAQFIASPGNLFFTYRSSINGQVKLRVMNAAGSCVKQVNQSINKGVNSVEMKLQNLPAGVYHMVVEQDRQRHSQAFIIR
jgi:WD40 repeat protein